MSKKTTQQFIEDAKKVHGEKYDYSKVEYIKSRTKVCIICPEHGEFWQRPENHLQGNGCPKCAIFLSGFNRRLDNKQFIEKAIKIHGDKYDYSKVIYDDTNTKVCIICPIHGEFWQRPYSHLQGNGCPKCANKLTTEKFIEKVKSKFGDAYSFEKTIYVDSATKLVLTCKQHGDFTVLPSQLFNGRHCPKCRRTEYLLRKTKEWKKQFIEKHGEKFDYSLIGDIIEYNNVKLPIICKKHNHLFYQDVIHHLINEYCCPLCQKECVSSLMSYDSEQFIEKAKEVHKDNYDYSKVEYINNQTKVCFICPEHGEFWQTPASHLQGKGCPICNESHLERDVRLLLQNNNVKFESQKRFDWLKYKDSLSLDFYLPQYNIAIECQGEQHFEYVPFFHNSINELKLTQKRDAVKKRLCEKNNIKLLYFSKLKYNEECIINLKTLLQEIKVIDNKITTISLQK